MTSSGWRSSQTSEKDAHSGEPGNDPSRFDGLKKLAKYATRFCWSISSRLVEPVFSRAHPQIWPYPYVCRCLRAQNWSSKFR